MVKPQQSAKRDLMGKKKLSVEPEGCLKMIAELKVDHLSESVRILTEM